MLYGQIELPIKKELRSIVEEKEEEKIESRKEWESSFQKKLYEWKKIYQFGTEENQFTDGKVLNQTQRELIEIYKTHLSEMEGADNYKKKIPQTVKDSYMAKEKEIVETAQRLVQKYFHSMQLRYVLVKRPQIKESDRRKLEVDILIGRIQKLESCVKKRDVLGMRIFSKEEELDQMLEDVYKKIGKLPIANNGIEGTAQKKTSVWKNQMTLEEFIC